MGSLCQRCKTEMDCDPDYLPACDASVSPDLGAWVGVDGEAVICENCVNQLGLVTCAACRRFVESWVLDSHGECDRCG
jgi:hypothetical protein